MNHYRITHPDGTTIPEIRYRALLFGRYEIEVLWPGPEGGMWGLVQRRWLWKRARAYADEQVALGPWWLRHG